MLWCFVLFDLIQVMGPFMHTLSHHKKTALRYPSLLYFKPNKGWCTLKKPDVMGTNRYHFWIQHEKMIKKHILFSRKT